MSSLRLGLCRTQFPCYIPLCFHHRRGLEITYEVDNVRYIIFKVKQYNDHLLSSVKDVISFPVFS